MYLIENYKDIVTKKFFCFEGRAGRKEFWMFFLANIIANVIINVIINIIGSVTAGISPKIGPIIQFVYFLAVLLPFLGVTARRLHDTGKSGWMQLLGFIPFVGYLIVLILCALEGQKEANRFGEPVACGCCCCEEKKEEQK